MICVFGLTMAIFACIWNAIGIDLGWLFLVMGLLIGGAVFPAAFTITWRGQTRAGAISGAVGGLAAGLIAWLVTAKQYYGTVTVSTTGQEHTTLAGNLAAIMTGLILTVAVSYIWPAKEPFDWAITRSINVLPEDATATSPEESNTGATTPTAEDEKKITPFTSDADPSATVPTVGDEEEQQGGVRPGEDEPAALRSAFKLACIAAFVLTFIMDFLIPIPMFLSHYTFSKGFFTAWVVISFIWVFCSSAITTLLPIIETLGFFKELVSAIRVDLRGAKRATSGS
jgi:hypothetical protein